MKRFCALLLLGAMGACHGALATSMSLHQFPPKVLPVLVQVDSQGKVTQASSAFELSPGYDRLLRQTLDQLITAPAKDHGRPVASQFIINLGLKTAARDDGKYDAQFFYVSTSPVPPGSWYWDHIDGHRLALRSQNSRELRFHPNPMELYRSRSPVRPVQPVRVSSQGAAPVRARLSARSSHRP